ncbi:MAG TPA: hypothetical protein VK808_00025 [Bacteroidia bacterium]|jgi:hypothetical protein|nr:hypothetical protein [Bacteroidia bacterium]
MEKELDKDKLIDLLMRENVNIRVELTTTLKSIHNCLYTFIVALSIFGGVFANLNSSHSIVDNRYIGILAFAVSQIEFVIVLFSQSLLADVMSKAAYITHLEDEISNLAGRKVIFWESIVAKYSHRAWGPENVSQVVLYLCYFAVYLWLTSVTATYYSCHLVIVNIFEAGVILFIMVITNKSLDKTTKHIKKKINSR